MHLSTKLRTLRITRKLTLAEVSQLTGLSVSFLSDVERGKTKASLDSLGKLATSYLLSIDELLKDVELESSTSKSDLPDGLAQWIEQNPQLDKSIIDLMRSAESRAIIKNRSNQDWQELYYALRRIYSR